ESHGAALCGAEGAHNEGGTDGIMAPGLAHTVLGIRTLICGQEATDLLLDINTAHNHVSVSGDRKSASFSLTKLHYPQSPERFRGVIQALSSRSFPSGRHYWEVEGSESGGWAVGVAYPSIERSGDQAGIGENNKSWCLRIGIWLDYEAGRLSFYELSEPIRHLHTFTATFTEPLHAAFWVGWCAWVRIIKEREKGADIVALRFQDESLDLSSRSFPSGRHYWEVEVSESGYWGVGVAYPSIERRGNQSGIGENNKSWGLYRWYNNRYSVEHDSEYTELPHVPSCRRIRISLDYEAGRLSFYELSEPIRHLHTFTATFTEPLYAIFWVGGAGAWMRII
ncbi:hypothetical protein XELAEV_18003143mg, partial [Xenopus laevis]